MVVRVHDPTAATQASRNADGALAAVSAPPVALVFTDSAGKARALPFVGSSGSTSEFSATVPPSAAFGLQGSSSLLALADTAGNRLPQNIFRSSITTPSSTPMPAAFTWQFSQPSAVPSLTFDLVVTGPLVP